MDPAVPSVPVSTRSTLLGSGIGAIGMTGVPVVDAGPPKPLPVGIGPYTGQKGWPVNVPRDDSAGT